MFSLGSHNADKLKKSWIYFLGGPEDDQVETCRPDTYTIVYKIKVVYID